MNNLRELFEESANRTPSKVFFIFKNEEVTYKDFLENVNRVANGFLSLGIQKGDKVAILLANCLEFPYCWLAANMIGAIMVPISNRFIEEEVKYTLHHSEARLLITSADYLKMIEKIKKDLQFLDKVIDISNSNINKIIPFLSLFENPKDLSPVDLHEDDLSAILYTSGTTGYPKGCMVGHDYFLTLGDMMGKLFKLTSSDCVLTAQPFHHMDPQWNTTMVMTYNATLVLGERFSTSKFWDQIRQYKITCFYSIGSMNSFLYNMPPSDLDREHHLRIAITSGIPPNIHKAWEERFNVPLYEAYGSSETGCDIAISPDMDRKVGTSCIGRPVYYREAKVVDENDVEVPPAQVGEIILKRGKGMMKGYYKNSEATKEVFRGGWFHTGDLGYKDEDGYFYFSGRKKDIIRRGGENISATSIEHVLMRHPKIIEAAVIPVPDKIRGEETKAYIVLKPNEVLNYEEIIDFCEKNMASIKIPRYIEFRDNLPKTPTNRVQKRKLMEEKLNLTEGCFDRLASLE